MSWCRWNCHYGGRGGGVCSPRFFNPPWTIPFKHPQIQTIMPFARSSWTNIITWCLQMFPHCAWTRLQHAHFNVGLWMVYHTWAFLDDMTSVEPPLGNVTFVSRINCASKKAPTTNICPCLLFMNPKFWHRLWY
jgi:hypothetical protein